MISIQDEKNKKVFNFILKTCAAAPSFSKVLKNFTCTMYDMRKLQCTLESSAAIVCEFYDKFYYYVVHKLTLCWLLYVYEKV